MIDLSPHLAPIAAYGFQTSLPQVDTEMLTIAEQLRLVEEATAHRMLGLLMRMVQSGAITFDATVEEVVADRHESWCSHALQAEALLLEISSVFEVAGIDHRWFKGPTLGHGVYQDSSARLYSDIDLVVPGRLYDRAKQLVIDKFDADPPFPELRPGFDAEFGKESLLKVGSVEVDLHRTFVVGGFGLMIPLDDLYSGTRTVAIGGHEIAVLDGEVEFLQTCINAALGDFPRRWISLRDVAQVAQYHKITPDQIAELTTSWRAAAVVQRAVNLTWDELKLAPTELAVWARELEPTAVERALLRSYLTTSRSYTRPLASVLVIRGLRAKMRYTKAVVRPQKAYLEHRGWTQRSHARRAIGGLRKKS